VEIELLGITSAIYQQLGEQQQYKALHDKQLALARERGGELDPVVIGSEIDDVDWALLSGRRSEAAEGLKLVNSALDRGRLNGSTLRAYWLYERSSYLSPIYSARAERLADLDRSIALYAKLSPFNRLYPQALEQRGTIAFEQANYAEAAHYYELALVAEGQTTGPDDGVRVNIEVALAFAQQRLGHQADAKATYAAAADHAERAFGRSSTVYWYAASRRAAFLHLVGARAQALEIFAEVIPNLSAPHALQRSGDAEVGAAYAQELYGAALVAEGRGAMAIPVLEAAKNLYSTAEYYDSDLPRVRSLLGQAYLESGQYIDARREMNSSLQSLQQRPEEDADLLMTKERLGRLLLRQGDIAEAATIFREVLAAPSAANPEAHVLALAGITRIELSRGNAHEALEIVRKAIEQFNGDKATFDVRVGTELWCLYAQALSRVGKREEARVWAQRAVTADRTYDANPSAALSEAEETLRAVTAS
jgi:tetratricopeptide (TPR) repeat protein